MKNKILIIILLIALIFSCCINFNKSSHTITKCTANTSNNENKIDINNEHKYKILAYYPNSEFDILDTKIAKKIDEYINQFKDDIKDVNVQLNQYYTLNIFYDTYEYKNYISYVFHVEYYTGGAHPNHEIFTVTYDKSKNKIIDINDLIKLNSNILNTLSSISRKKLLKSKNIVDSNMMLEGTTPTIENFSNFAFSKDGLITFFEYYQVAPYSSGEFQVNIPYSELNLLL